MSVIVTSGITLRRSAQLLLMTLGVSAAGCLFGCLGSGGAVNVRWRIAERETGRVDDPRDDSDPEGVCCQKRINGQCTPQSGWHIERVQLVLATPSGTDGGLDAGVMSSPDFAGLSGLTAKCSARELTTPFEIPPNTYAITLRAFDDLADANPNVAEAQSPIPEIRQVVKAEIVQLDVVELSVSATQTL